MRNFLCTLAIAFLLAGIAVWGTGCKKKVEPTAPTTTTTQPSTETRTSVPAPTVTLTASPAAIAQGQSSTLTWRTTNATEVTIDGGIGTVEASGSRTVTPSASTTFRATATSAGGTANAEARITVGPAELGVIVPPERPLTDVDWFPMHISDALFDYDRYDIREDARQVLLADASALKERPNIRITIEGHCDERGSESYNIALGDKRASAAKNFLVSQGIDPARIDTISYGKEKPAALGHDEQSWQQNRRAHLVMR